RRWRYRQAACLPPLVVELVRQRGLGPATDRALHVSHFRVTHASREAERQESLQPAERGHWVSLGRERELLVIVRGWRQLGQPRIRPLWSGLLLFLFRAAADRVEWATMIDLSPVLERLARIEAILEMLLGREAVKEWYTTEEFAGLVGKSAFTTREWCRLG